MKLIFDFDDVLFQNTKLFKPHIFSMLEKHGISKDISCMKYKEMRETNSPFSLREFVDTLLAPDAYNEIMSPVIKNFLYHELVTLAEKIGQENCYLVTNGEEEFQKEKVRLTETAHLFKEIVYVPYSKKDAIEKICTEHKDEKIIFIEDRMKFIEDLDLSLCPNLEIILFDETGLEKLKKILRIV